MNAPATGVISRKVSDQKYWHHHTASVLSHDVPACPIAETLQTEAWFPGVFSFFSPDLSAQHMGL